MVSKGCGRDVFYWDRVFLLGDGNFLSGIISHKFLLILLRSFKGRRQGGTNNKCGYWRDSNG